MEAILYDALPMPKEINAIILLYVKCVVRQVYIDDKPYYVFDGYSTPCERFYTVGIINNDIYHFTFGYNPMLLTITNYNNSYRVNLSIGPVLRIKYGNNLICEYSNAIKVYNIDIVDDVLTINLLYSLPLQHVLLYADNDRIIMRDIHNSSLLIYNDKLQLKRTIYTTYRVNDVALFNDRLSYTLKNCYPNKSIIEIV